MAWRVTRPVGRDSEGRRISVLLVHVSLTKTFFIPPIGCLLVTKDRNPRNPGVAKRAMCRVWKTEGSVSPELGDMACLEEPLWILRGVRRF